MRRKNNNNVKAFALSGSLAAVAGFIAGILAAPKSGKEIRGDIHKAGERSRVEAEQELKSLSADLNKSLKEAKSRSDKLSLKTKTEIDSLVDKGEETNAKVREILSALHSGEAEDQDLKRAIKNAKSALEHLRDYLSK
jgi:gas vesicle protein